MGATGAAVLACDAPGGGRHQPVAVHAAEGDRVPREQEALALRLPGGDVHMIYTYTYICTYTYATLALRLPGGDVHMIYTYTYICTYTYSTLALRLPGGDLHIAYT